MKIRRIKLHIVCNTTIDLGDMSFQTHCGISSNVELQQAAATNITKSGNRRDYFMTEEPPLEGTFAFEYCEGCANAEKDANPLKDMLDKILGAPGEPCKGCGVVHRPFVN